MSASGKDIPSNPQALAEASSAAMHARDRVAHDLGMEILDVGPGRAELAMTVTERMVNGHAVCHGGYIFMLADTAFAHACNTHGEATVGAAADTQFLAPAKQGDRLLATARERQRGRRQGIYDVEVYVGETLIALFRGRSASTGKSNFQSEVTGP
jgi:acyl-CoA thioesterase